MRKTTAKKRPQPTAKRDQRTPCLNKELLRAIRACNRVNGKTGGQSTLAAELTRLTGKHIRQGHIWAWGWRTGRVPPEFVPYVEAIARERGCEVSRAALCPDFPWSAVAHPASIKAEPVTAAAV